MFTLFIVLAISGCDLIRIKETDDDNRVPIARARDQYLYAEDIQNLISEEISAEDSIKRVKNYVESWARKQLLISEASTIIDFDEAEIERKMLDYRYSLMGYEYQKYYIDKNLNKEISEQEVHDYYENNIDNFVLKQNIIRGKYIKVPKEAPSTRRIKSLINSNKAEDFEELKSYCLSFASAYQLYDSVWMVFEDVVKSSPLAEIPNKVQFLKTRKYTENTDDEFLYFLKIEEYRISDNVSPIEFVREQIKNIIINKRKVELAKKLEDDVYQKAKNENEFEVY
ncbi:MAG: peptidyl-prolyl cis-trans isomerase [Cyclobacteriaceae bacterium]|nr:peptidyl-prolyl cis-trans isomerase [Cyclobacteriaceae bacterium]